MMEQKQDVGRWTQAAVGCTRVRAITSGEKTLSSEFLHRQAKRIKLNRT
jgi:hypothetical protein